ncbi:MAG: pantoate--beta-alanine ligase [Pseudomonadales bacterium]|jgi:pantoate--beta-alanine ligase|nr:pantoate--beta-alanine ligase [Pseudomonadales bacterium]MDP6316000.1 pantoate--beta-alanine ligase [Pseudomonadales bacterium]MDP7314206.1 pantoate--beta-alanine ligase [Pseudomonadales bacterium]MDP7576332.1 pantoate--beta-alanine ligase [Pseudomonadales bacterium]|tara:strand:- start:551 stop:1321 length:771 start_codon:yes stop_codon:yes gene_type:complete
MKIIDSVNTYREMRKEFEVKKIGFVPTMGALHIGHAALIERSVAECDVTVLSIYLNPTQFDNIADLEKYPATVEADLELAKNLGIEIVLMPDYEQMYPDGFRYQVEETQFSHRLCGAHRTGHFTGVLTVVMKLLNIVRPQRAYFGEKDFQQYKLIESMADAFFLDVEIVACQTVREEDGLAFSSRNLNLDNSERKLAPRLYEALVADVPDEDVCSRLTDSGFDVDYIETYDGRRFGAAKLGKVRLIDNVSIAEVSQ